MRFTSNLRFRSRFLSTVTYVDFRSGVNSRDADVKM